MSENVANLLLIGGANSDGAPDPTGASSAPAAVGAHARARKRGAATRRGLLPDGHSESQIYSTGMGVIFGWPICKIQQLAQWRQR